MKIWGRRLSERGSGKNNVPKVGMKTADSGNGENASWPEKNKQREEWTRRRGQRHRVGLHEGDPFCLWQGVSVLY